VFPHISLKSVHQMSTHEGGYISPTVRIAWLLLFPSTKVGTQSIYFFNHNLTSLPTY